MLNSIVIGILLSLSGLSMSESLPAKSPSSHYPNLIRAEMPLYPSIAWSAHITGTVEIEVTVEHGSVVGARVKSSSSPFLTKPTVANVQTWQFESEARATFLVKYVYETKGERTSLPENPRIELDLPRLVRITVRPFKPTST